MDDSRGARAVEMVKLDYLHSRLHVRLEGLTDHEYLWEPVAGCLTMDGGSGKVVRHGPVGLTNIAWRLCHIGDALREERNFGWLGREPTRLDAEIVHPMTAAGALDYIDDSWRVWQDLVGSLSVDEMWQPIGAIGGPYGGSERLTFVLHVMDEFIHHGAEVGVLRDLYAATMAP